MVKYLLYLFLICGILSCRSTENGIDGNNNVRINLMGSEFEKVSVKPLESGADPIQREVIPFDKTTSIIANLTPEFLLQKSENMASVSPMANTPVRTEIKSGIKYKVVVYNSDGSYNTEKDFVTGDRDSGLYLQEEKDYTFVVYALNSSTVPTVNNGALLSNAKLSGLKEDLMYFKKDMRISKNGINNLDVVLKHQFGQITIIMDGTDVGSVTAVTTSTITGGSDSGDIKFKDNSISYSGSGNVPVTFPTLNQLKVMSAPAIVIGTTSAGVFNLGSVTVGGMTRNNLKMNNLKITPGVKYNLNLKLQKLAETFDVSENVTAYSEEKRLQRLRNELDFTSTGLYKPTNEILKINVEVTAGTRAPKLLIGTYSRSKIYNSIPTEIQLKAGLNEISNPVGGLLWIRYTDDNPMSKSKVSFTSGFKKAPYFISGKTTNAQWKEMLSNMSDIPDAILEGDFAIVVVSRNSAIKYQDEDLNLSLRKLGEMQKIQDDFSGLDGSASWNRRHAFLKILLVENEDPAWVGYYAALAYRTTYDTEGVSSILKPGDLTSSKQGWVIWHENGHQHEPYWNWSQLGEVTVNIYARAVERVFAPNENRLSSNRTWFDVPTYFALPDRDRDFNGDKASVWVRLCMFEQLRLAFGENFYPLLHKRGRQFPLPNGSTDAQAMDYFMKLACQVSGRNLSAFFKKWGLNTQSAVYNEIAALNLPNPSVAPSTLDDDPNFSF